MSSLDGPLGPGLRLPLGQKSRRNLRLFWTTADLQSKPLDFKTYFNHYRTHSARAGRPPDDARLGRSRTSNLIDGNLTVEDCIKHL